MGNKSKTTEVAEGNHSVAMERLLTVDDVSSLLQLSRVQVYELIKRGGLPSIKINGARRIQPGKLKAWIEQHSEQG